MAGRRFNAEKQTSGISSGVSIAVLSFLPFQLSLRYGFLAGLISYILVALCLLIPGVNRAYCYRPFIKLLIFPLYLIGFVLSCLANSWSESSIWILLGYGVTFLQCLVFFIEYNWTTGWPD